MVRVLIIFALILVAGCKPEAGTPSPVAITNQTYAVRGVVQEIPPDHRHASVKHEKIPGYMAAMTMDFSVKDTNLLNEINAGDEITFNLVVAENDDWIENIQVIGKTNTSVMPTWRIVESELKTGDVLPDFEFTGEDGKTFRFSDFRGRALAFTFFLRAVRCRNFARA